MPKNTLHEDRNLLRDMPVEKLQQIFDNELYQVPVEMAYGGVNTGHETIQRRFYGWRKGTPRFRIEQWFHDHGVNAPNNAAAGYV